MALSTLKPSTLQAQQSACPHCGRSFDSPRPAFVETGLRVLAGLILVSMLVPLAVIAWKSCFDFLTDKVSHSTIYHPLEDWTRY